MRSAAGWLASATPETVEAFMEGLSPNALAALPWLFEIWALPHQLPPEGDWKTWVIMGGRGAGKTRAGAEWIRSEVEGARPLHPGRSRRVALVGETLEQVREVMVFGESGILACSPPDRMPVWEATRRRLVWPNGAVAQIFSAHDPESLRGPQFDCAWVDELAKWRKASDTWDMLQFGLRLGDQPRQVVTTTPRNVGVLRDILRNGSTTVTHAPTEANRAHLAASFLSEVRARYAGTRLGRQELDGLLVDEAEGALWTAITLDRARLRELPALTRVVVAVDPPVTGHGGSDDCGIVVAGVVAEGPPQDWRAVVIEDASVSAASPDRWARAALAAAERHGAERVVAEVNQGGDLVESLLRSIDPLVPFRAVRASRGKAARAEPVAALYEQGRVRHMPGLDRLEDQMCRMTAQGYEGRGSPDRLDALVWALTELMIVPAQGWRKPGIRLL
ncbi:ATP-binding protein [Haematobacter massiliensis]|uniref:ATP-binding protein n=1 Tax=Haematobacter massiliensis TaxID=195105 RepID=A0A086YBK8_9RHOB|nr:terminase family protein [Haematobacter massiliensis]KFI31658.1 ATP-binding protein [Haematobacter massiliensis]OWJ72047.1 ATP-binding protein [Haematobacter massiliensis]OWJ81551.1 ATP-binding protein [Haematobacter massiliensis]QBJ24052.1 ATP-binding protein [Haematobacter massiliensis]